MKLVKASFGSPQLDVPQPVQKELGGGALLDIGVCCFVLMVFNSPSKLLDSGMIQHTAHGAEVGCRLVSFTTQHTSVITN